MLNGEHYNSLSQRRACGLTALSRSTCRYQPKWKDPKVEERLKVLAAKKISYGYRMLYHLLRREGYNVNHKRVYALYKKNGLGKRKKKKKRYPQRKRNPLMKASKPNEMWAMDFMTDSCSNGRKIRTLNVIDLYARECLKIEVGHSMPSSKVIAVLEEIALGRRLPEKIIVDNGPEYTSKILKEWAEKKGITLDYIAPGRPMENGYVESFNGRFREECLNQNWFQNILEASEIAEEWRKDYNNNRPHSSLGYLTPREYLRKENKEKPGKVYL